MGQDEGLVPLPKGSGRYLPTKLGIPSMLEWVRGPTSKFPLLTMDQPAPSAFHTWMDLWDFSAPSPSHHSSLWAGRLQHPGVFPQLLTPRQVSPILYSNAAP